MWYNELGDSEKETIVFIHGAGVNSFMWEEQLKYFNDYHCIAVDLLEHGNSRKDGEFNIRKCSEEIIKIIESKTNNKKAILIGHSIGAKIVVDIMSIKPEVIDRAIILSALFKMIKGVKRVHKKYIYDFTIFLLKFKKITKIMVKQLQFPNDVYENKCIEEFECMTSKSLYNIYNELLLNIQIPNNIENANIETLIISGDKEPKEMKQSVVELKEKIANSKGLFLKGEMHNYPWKSYEKTNEIIRKWLEREDVYSENVIEVK